MRPVTSRGKLGARSASQSCLAILFLLSSSLNAQRVTPEMRAATVAANNTAARQQAFVAQVDAEIRSLVTGTLVIAKPGSAELKEKAEALSVTYPGFHAEPSLGFEGLLDALLAYRLQQLKVLGSNLTDAIDAGTIENCARVREFADHRSTILAHPEFAQLSVADQNTARELLEASQRDLERVQPCDPMQDAAD